MTTFVTASSPSSAPRRTAAQRAGLVCCISAAVLVVRGDLVAGRDHRRSRQRLALPPVTDRLHRDYVTAEHISDRGPLGGVGGGAHGGSSRPGWYDSTDDGWDLNRFGRAMSSFADSVRSAVSSTLNSGSGWSGGGSGGVGSGGDGGGGSGW